MMKPDAWLKVSSIAGTIRGVYLTQDVELKSENLVPLYRHPPAKVHISDREIVDAINSRMNQSLLMVPVKNVLQIPEDVLMAAIRGLIDRAQNPKPASGAAAV